MSHWIDQPALIRVSDDVCLFTVNDGNWSAWTVRWLDDSTVELFMRKYPDQPACTLQLNVLTNQAKAVGRSKSITDTFSRVQEWILTLK